MVLIYSGMQPSAHYFIELNHGLTECDESLNLPSFKDGEELATSTQHGVLVTTENDVDIEISVYLGNSKMDTDWFPIHSGEILVDKEGLIVGNFLSNFSKVLLEIGKYHVSVYTDTGESYNATKVAFVLEKIA